MGLNSLYTHQCTLQHELAEIVDHHACKLTGLHLPHGTNLIIGWRLWHWHDGLTGGYVCPLVQLVWFHPQVCHSQRKYTHGRINNSLSNKHITFTHRLTITLYNAMCQMWHISHLSWNDHLAPSRNLYSLSHCDRYIWGILSIRRHSWMVLPTVRVPALTSRVHWCSLKKSTPITIVASIASRASKPPFQCRVALSTALFPRCLPSSRQPSWSDKPCLFHIPPLCPMISWVWMDVSHLSWNQC